MQTHLTAPAIDFPSYPLVGTSLRDDLSQLIGNALARHRHRRLLRKLARRSSHLLRDMGFDPREVQMAAEDSWDEYRPELMLRRAPWISPADRP